MPNLTEQLKRDWNLLTRSQPKGKAPRRRIPPRDEEEGKGESGILGEAEGLPFGPPTL